MKLFGGNVKVHWSAFCVAAASAALLYCPDTAFAKDGSTGAASARDGPFGIAIGEPLAALGAVKDMQDGYYQVLSPPKPSTYFPFVVVVAFPKLGVCRIVAATELFELDTSGSSARQRTDEIAATLKLKYGDYTKVNTCEEQELCDSTWLAQLSVNKARYGYFWPSLPAKGADGVASIELEVVASTAVNSEVRLSYLSAKPDDCDTAIKAASGAAL